MNIFAKEDKETVELNERLRERKEAQSIKETKEESRQTSKEKSVFC